MKVKFGVFSEVSGGLRVLNQGCKWWSTNCRKGIVPARQSMDVTEVSGGDCRNPPCFS